MSTTRLIIVNERATDVWIEFQASPTTPTNFPKIQKISASQQYVYNIPKKLVAARWWVKTGCNEVGEACEFGNSVTYQTEAQPPLETKFEGTFGNDGTTLDYFDVSLVDGFSVPFRLKLSGDVRGSSLPKDQEIDCSSLSPNDCPMETTLDFEGGGLDLKYYGNYDQQKNPLACFSPCKKLNYSTGAIGQGLGLPEHGNTKTFSMCCPGPDATKGQSCNDAAGKQFCPFHENQCLPVDKKGYDDLVAQGMTCTINESCGCCCTCASTDKSINPYPIVNSDYVKYCHTRCPVYAWAYDDYLGTITVPTGQVYDITWTLVEPSETPGPTPPPQKKITWWWLWLLLALVVVGIIMTVRRHRPIKKSRK